MTGAQVLLSSVLGVKSFIFMVVEVEGLSHSYLLTCNSLYLFLELFILTFYTYDSSYCCQFTILFLSNTSLSSLYTVLQHLYFSLIIQHLKLVTYVFLFLPFEVSNFLKTAQYFVHQLLFC